MSKINVNEWFKFYSCYTLLIVAQMIIVIGTLKGECKYYRLCAER